jgi:hypothetical protein
MNPRASVTLMSLAHVRLLPYSIARSLPSDYYVEWQRTNQSTYSGMPSFSVT